MYKKLRICISTYLKSFIDLIAIYLVTILFSLVIQRHFLLCGEIPLMQ